MQDRPGKGVWTVGTISVNYSPFRPACQNLKYGKIRLFVVQERIYCKEAVLHGRDHGLAHSRRAGGPRVLHKYLVIGQGLCGRGRAMVKSAERCHLSAHALWYFP